MKKVILRALGISTTLGVAGLIGTGLVVAEGEPQGGASTTFSVNIERMLEVTIPGAISGTTSLTVDPSKDEDSLGKGVRAVDIAVNVATNNPTGYELYMYASSGNLVNTTNNEKIIPNLPSGKTFGSTDVTSAWGFKLKSGSQKSGNSIVTYSTSEFATVPTGDREFKARVTDGAGQTSSTVFSFGVKVTDTNVAPGTYVGVINFVAVANEVPFTGTLQDIKNMQDDNIAAACANTPTPLASDGASTPQYQLKDTRDNKTYYVAKLADGNCWMTQNLDLDLSTTKTLNSSDTDLVGDYTYTPVVSTTTGNVFNSSDYTGENSYDDGGYYWNGQWDGNWDSYSNYNSFSKFSTAAPSQGDHYRAGNLYQWSAATAKTGNGLNNGAEAAGSICPKGWRLPYSGDNTTDKSFGKLLTAYTATSDTSKIIASPLFFVPAGYVDDGSLDVAGDVGYYWSSRANSVSNTDFAYYFFFNSGGFVYPSLTYSRYVGFSVRCVVR